MQNVEWLLDSPARNVERRRFFEVFAEEVARATSVHIAVGYLSTESVHHLSEVVTALPEFKLELTLGMHAREGITKRQLDAAKSLHEFLKENGRGGVYVTPRMAYHGKIYLFENAERSVGYIGSANLSSILPLYRGTYEAGLVLKDQTETLLEHLVNQVYPRRCSIDNADIPIVEKASSPMIHVEDAASVTTSALVEIFSSPATYTFELPLKAEKASSLNAHMAAGGIRKNKHGGIRRDWYEGELIVSKGITEQLGYPEKGVPFRVVTDDGWAFECVVNGGNKKNFRSSKGLSVFGTWMKSRLMEAGVLEFGELATDDTIERYGRDTLTLKYHPDFQVWSLDLSVATPKI